MNRDFILAAAMSIGLHVILAVGVIVISPMRFPVQRDYQDVVHVNVVSAVQITPQIAPATIKPAPVETPAAIEEELPDIPIDDPTTQPEAEIEEPVEEPEPEPEPEKPEPRPNETNDVKPQEGNHTPAGDENGNVEVQAPAGSLISGASVDNASFNYPYWFDLTWSKLAQNFRIPFAVDGKIEAEVYFQVLKSGRVIESKVVTSSGFAKFDEACLNAVDRSAPFPPLPREFLDEIIGITVAFTNR